MTDMETAAAIECYEGDMSDAHLIAASRELYEALDDQQCSTCRIAQHELAANDYVNLTKDDVIPTSAEPAVDTEMIGPEPSSLEINTSFSELMST